MSRDPAAHSAESAPDEVARAPGADAVDSAGQEWQGRHLTSTGFDDDEGAADPALLAVLSADSPDPGQVVRALAAARMLVPVVAHPGELDESGPHAEEKSTDMAAVTLVAPDGTRALPVFSSLAALADWDAQARPVPVTAARAAQAAVGEECQVMVLDVGSDHVTELRPSMVWALAQGREWHPAHEDQVVAAAVGAAVGAETDIVAHEVREGSPPGRGALGLVLTLRPGLEAEEVQGLLARVAERLGGDPEVRTRVDGLGISLR